MTKPTTRSYRLYLCNRWLQKNPLAEPEKLKEVYPVIMAGICPDCRKNPTAPDRDTCVDCSH